MKANPDIAKRIVERHFCEEFDLPAILREIQRERGYLAEEDLVLVSKRLQVPLSRTYALATFYRSFALSPRGRTLVQVCTGKTCELMGAQSVLERLCRWLRVGPGETTRDGAFTLETVRCAGVCAKAPVVVVGGEVVQGSNASALAERIEKARALDAAPVAGR